jgi:hypothetical protein
VSQLLCDALRGEPEAAYALIPSEARGSGDSMTLAIAHMEGDRAILDCVRERKPYFSTDDAAKEFADTIKSYGIHRMFSCLAMTEVPVAGEHDTAKTIPAAEIQFDRIAHLRDPRACECWRRRHACPKPNRTSLEVPGKARRPRLSRPARIRVIGVLRNTAADEAVLQ